jgi:hypothetical protein
VVVDARGQDTPRWTTIITAITAITVIIGIAHHHLDN